MRKRGNDFFTVPFLVLEFSQIETKINMRNEGNYAAASHVPEIAAGQQDKQLESEKRSSCLSHVILRLCCYVGVT